MGTPEFFQFLKYTEYWFKINRKQVIFLIWNNGALSNDLFEKLSCDMMEKRVFMY